MRTRRLVQYVTFSTVSALVAFTGCFFGPDDAGLRLPRPIFPKHHKSPAWSSQGLIAYFDAGITLVRTNGFFTVDPSLQGLWILDPESGEKTRLLSGRRLFHPSWSPEGDQLVVSNGHLFVTPTVQIDLRQLTFEARNLYPAWSPDGDWISYASTAGDSVRTWLVHPDGTGRHALNLNGINAISTRWLPDDRLVHIRGVDRNQDRLSSTEVFLMNGDGTSEVRITNDGVDDDFPAVSPDGRRIAVVKVPDGALPQIWVMNLNGSDARRLTSFGGTTPDWSPDGSRIVYTRENWRTNDLGNGVLWVVDVETGEETQLTTKWSEQSP